MTNTALNKLLDALEPLVKIVEAYDDNDLDDDARKYWGINLQYKNERDPKDIILYQGRGGKTLLTLLDCINASNVYEKYSVSR